MTVTEANNAIAAENTVGTQIRDNLFPPGFSYRPPIENICGCGTKHTGSGRSCTVCTSEISSRDNRSFP